VANGATHTTVWPVIAPTHHDKSSSGGPTTLWTKNCSPVFGAQLELPLSESPGDYTGSGQLPDAGRDLARGLYHRRDVLNLSKIPASKKASRAEQFAPPMILGHNRNSRSNGSGRHGRLTTNDQAETIPRNASRITQTLHLSVLFVTFCVRTIRSGSAIIGIQPRGAAGRQQTRPRLRRLPAQHD